MVAALWGTLSACGDNGVGPRGDGSLRFLDPNGRRDLRVAFGTGIDGGFARDAGDRDGSVRDAGGRDALVRDAGGCSNGALNPPTCSNFSCAAGLNCGGYGCSPNAMTCLTHCAVPADCATGYTCNARACVPSRLAPDGESCAGRGHSACASGYCDGTLCCASGSCCNSAADCPASMTGVPSCTNPSGTTDCQGTRLAPRCEAHVCSAEAEGDDSACAGVDHACDNHLAPVACASTADQPPPQCPATCTSDGQCLAGYLCQQGACVVDVAAACTVTVEPIAGGLTEVFQPTLTATASACSYVVDHAAPVALRCNGVPCCSFAGRLTGADLGGVGHHELVVTATGATSTGSCRAEYEVLAAPSCSASLSPAQGAPTTNFTVVWDSSGTSCTWDLDGVPQAGTIDCKGSTGDLLFAAGAHHVTLHATGAGGSASCDSNSVTVTQPPQPTCSAAISPGSGTTNTDFTITWNSDGSACTWDLDGASQGPVPCTGSTPNTRFGAGNHAVTLHATGPGGSTQCQSGSVTVTQAPLPTCSASISPSSGNTNTDFNISWSSDGSSCTWDLDGVDQGAVPCSGAAPSSRFSAGDHAVTLHATGPGGTTQCDSNAVTVTQVTPPPSCGASITPASGDTRTSFGISWNSDGTSCTWALDGVSQGAVDCTGFTAADGLFGVGSHFVTLRATGPGGSTSCDSNHVTVTQPPALPTCSASISPSSGNTDTDFTITWSSNGSSCTWALDGVDQGAVPCSGSAPSSRFTVGNHTVTLRTTGPGGSTQCNSNAVSVTQAPALPTCSASISPGSGNTNSDFNISWSSNGSSCTWALDGVNQGAVPCSGNAPNSRFVVGNHYVTLRTTGPGGTTQCNSNAVSVTQAPALPTCSASISPGSGNTNSDFNISWSSNGSSCTWALDGVDQGAVPCSGNAPSSRFTVGNHTVTLRTTGPGGSTQCNSNAVSVTQAPALPTCSASISPGSGNTNSDFNISWSSNGSSCTWALDGVNQGAVPCSGNAPNSRFVVGNHYVTLRTTGPGGTTQCNSNAVSVTQAPALPTCSASISPGSGNTNSDFNISWSSNGSSCTWALDGVNQGAVPCSGNAPNSRFVVGNHYVTLRTTGPGGTTQCNSNAVSVTQAPALPTCSASISPGSGNTNSDFNISWSSNGSSCTWALDGVNQGAVPCSGNAPNSRFVVGNHTVTLRTTGPGGSTSCDSNRVTVTQAPALPTCSASISPGSGNTNTNFTISWSSNGSSCTWALDGVNQGAVPCSGSAPNSRFTVGNHTVTLRTTGPGGSTSCDSNRVTVTQPPALPTCSASISPGSGNTNTDFNISWSSNGSSCTWALDGVNQGAVPCSGSAPNSRFTVGNHTVTLRTTGPGGSTSCDSNRVTVTQPPALPTCSASISPGSGNTNTDFTISWSSNGSSCTWALDGVSQGAVPCSGNAPNSRFTVGNHTVTLRTTGPGGSTQCNSNTVAVTQPPALPTCAASISPGSGNTNTDFTINWSSNGSSCTWALDGVSQGAVPCSGAAPNSRFTVGNHTVTLRTTGPGGSTQCNSNTVAVTQPPALPTCSASISPGSGNTDTNFTITWSSNGSSCTWALDGVNQGAVPCSGSAPNSRFTVGNHTVTLRSTGPGGSTSCDSNRVTVTQPPALPTCSASISPGSGNTKTDFNISWSSNGSSCTWALDGVNQGAVPCSGSAPNSRFPVGNHYVTLRTTGPGGSTQCNSNTVSVR